ncbi:reticulophagy regulator 3-like [Pollicipes pollicipes]|uniref:reticulophagy regulator 3-like n=1 Tax=Pollicipes pollicipes TaxID=41117 RepID=UPI0018859BC7|nr:reticulophagy regulator 3-like [Pollicipes pollicipes]XP_037069442.1 reticulophagy regulator 3-like [Pollicipes pollicipes]XP_037069443.1 reticulophagy regulator 3-like [Pollicipes pollicipes]
MESVKSFFWRWNPFSKSHCKETKSEVHSTEDPVAATISTAESSLVSLQKIAVWESPINSMLAVIGLNAVCWLISTYQLRVVFVVAAVALLRLLRTEWRERIWPEIRVPPPVAEDPEPWTDVGVSVLSAPEMIEYVRRLRAASASLRASLAEMRASTPFMFFLLVNSAWALLYWLSRCVSGATLAHVLPTLALTVPGALLHLVPAAGWVRLRQLLTDGRRTVANSGLLQDEDCERDFVPEASPETQAYLDVMADIINGREPSPDVHEVAAFSAGLAAAPGYDEESDDDALLAPSVERSAELDFRGLPLTERGADADATPAAAAAGGWQADWSGAGETAAALGRAALSSAAAACGRAAQLVTAVQPPPPGDDSDSDFELIGDEEALGAEGH